MDDASFLPTFPFAAANLMLVGAVLLCGLAAGQVFVRFLRLPRITGFVAAGLLLGPAVFNLIDQAMLAELSIFVDISLGLILFELGRRLDIRWLIHDRWLLASSVGESLLSFVLVFATLRLFNVGGVYAATAAAIAMATSPAVLLMIIHDRRAKGPLTERMLALTALNNVFAFLLITLLFGFVHLEYKADWVKAVAHPLYLIFGSILLGYLAFMIARWLARWLGKREDAQFVMLLGLIVTTVGFAISFKLSVLLALLAFGVFVKNQDRDHDLMAVEFATLRTGGRRRGRRGLRDRAPCRKTGRPDDVCAALGPYPEQGRAACRGHGADVRDCCGDGAGRLGAVSGVRRPPFRHSAFRSGHTGTGRSAGHSVGIDSRR